MTSPVLSAFTAQSFRVCTPGVGLILFLFFLPVSPRFRSFYQFYHALPSLHLAVQQPQNTTKIPIKTRHVCGCNKAKFGRME